MANNNCDINEMLFSINNYKLENVPNTLYYIPNFISTDEEECLLNCVNNVPKTRWKQLANRRLQNWGGQPHSKGMIVTETLPTWLDIFTKRIVNLGVFQSFIPNHCLINEYLPNQGIMPHTDGPLYYPVVSTISLNSHTIIEFYRTINDEEENREETVSNIQSRRICSVLLEPRSLFLVMNDMYKNYLHGIRELNEDEITNDICNLDLCDKSIVQLGNRLKRTTRVSLTIRYVPKVTKFQFANGIIKK